MVQASVHSERAQTLAGQTVCLTGATGFIGSHLVPLLLGAGARVKVLTRSAQTSIAGVESVVGDLFDQSSLVAFLREADVLINLAQPADAVSDEQFSSAIRHLAHAAREARVRRVLHISTAMVIGVPAARRVNEDTPGEAKTVYERQKLSAEITLRAELGAQVDLGILRPTAVFGAGGQNLLKLAEGIAGGSVLKRRVLRFLHGRRALHLVSVHEVVAAIMFLASLDRPLAGQVFLVAADDQPANNYQAVDGLLAAAMGKPVLGSSVRLPGALLKFLLRLVGRSQADPNLIYDGAKLRSWGFEPPVEFTSALREFAEAYMKNRAR